MSQIEQLEKQLKELSEKIEALKNPEIEVGKWYIENDWGWVVRVNRIDIDDVYGDYFDEYGNYYSDRSVCEVSDIERPATPSEIETALRKEAERRGYKEGVLVRSALSEEKVHLGGEIGYVFNRDGTGDDLALGGCSIYNNGKWAEIIKNEKFFEWDMEKFDISTYDNPLLKMYKIGCESYKSTFLEDLKSALEYVSDKTVQEVLDELKKLDL